ncbi:MAG: hypothetical protein RQ757_03285 [Pseudomonadales bacterium]|nr:hypothetical protein [Pseudomonadales bacterium]
MNNNVDQFSVSRLEIPLLTLRLGVFIVMFMWTLDKFINPQHAAGIFQNFYGISLSAGAVVYTLAALELILLLLFLSGLVRTWSYGAVMVLHGVSTLSAYNQYLDPFNNLLFFAAWPMLAASFALFMLRDYDNKLVLPMGKP